MAQPSTRSPAGRTTATAAGALYRPMGHLVVRAPLLPVDAYRALGHAGPGPRSAVRRRRDSERAARELEAQGA